MANEWTDQWDKIESPETDQYSFQKQRNNLIEKWTDYIKKEIQIR